MHESVAAIRNSAGKFVSPGIRTITAAAAAVSRVPADNQISLVAPPASQPRAYPVATFSYVIVPTSTDKAAALRRFIFYGLTQGQRFGATLGFAPIPKIVLVAGEKTLLRIHTP